MIKESIQQTIKLIEDIQKVDPLAYQQQEMELNNLVQHMKVVMSLLDKKEVV
jgi:hypothetical protein